MSEQKLREAFEGMKPSDESRRRMFDNIMAAREQLSGAGEVKPALKPKKVARKFSLLRYALPAAACLLFAAIVPFGLPQLAGTFEDRSDMQLVQGSGMSASDSAGVGAPADSADADDSADASDNFDLDIGNDVSYGAGSFSASMDDTYSSGGQSVDESPQAAKPDPAGTPEAEEPPATIAPSTPTPSVTSTADAPLIEPSKSNTPFAMTPIQVISLSITLALISAAAVILSIGLLKRRSLKRG